MRICCPICGERDLREFHYEGSSKLIDRPEMGAGLVEFHDYLHLRDNLAGINEELWSHAVSYTHLTLPTKRIV